MLGWAELQVGTRLARHTTATEEMPGLEEVPCLECSLQGNSAVVENSTNTTETCTGLTGNTFKKRYYGHRRTFEKENHENHTTLSSHVWDLKKMHKNYNISWSVIDRTADFNPSTKKCRLCLKEKFYINFHFESTI